MKILIAPDKFKGSLTANEVCDIVSEAILSKNPNAETIKLPMADGGEGSLAVIKSALQSDEVKMFVKDPMFRTIMASYERKGDTAYIEMAAASGLQLVKESQRNPLYTSTYGTGQLIKHAIKNGVKKVYLFVGGSATNDGGMGMLQALGFQFLDQKGEDLFGIGESMSAVEKINAPDNLPDFDLDIVCDVENLFYGEKGAAYVYAPQKGASKEDIILLDQGLQNLAKRFEIDLGIDISQLKGAGAAGGIAGGAMAGLGGKIVSGIETIMKLVNFEAALENCDLVITGEGKIDQQTLHGKLIQGIASAAHKSGVDCIAFCGVNELSRKEETILGLKKVISLKNEGMSKQEAIEKAGAILKTRTLEVFKSID